MADPRAGREPVKPAHEGTHEMPGIAAAYTLGRDHVLEAARAMLRRGLRIAVDIETEGLHAAALNIKSVALADEHAAVIFDPRDPAQHQMLRKIMALVVDLQGWLIFHHAAFDVPNMARNGLFDVDWCTRVLDTLVYARLAEPDELVKKSLEKCWERWGTGDGELVNDRELFRLMGEKKSEAYRKMDLHLPIFIKGAAIDALVTARLLARTRLAAYRTTTMHPFTGAGVTGDEAWRLVQREQRLNAMMLRRACRGLRVDMQFLDRYLEENAEAITAAGNELEAAGIRPTVAGDLVKALEADNAFPEGYKRTAKNKTPSTEKKQLEKVNHPLAKAWVRRKELVKVETDYLGKVSDLASSAGRIHPVTEFLAATTGRMSMGSPPLQQFPGPARGIVMADEGGSMTSIDWSQIEPVLAANLAGEETFLARYEDLTVKADIYTPIAEAAGITRKHAKIVLLATLYGQGKATLAAGLGVSVDEAVALQAKVRGAMPKVADLDKQLRYLAREHEMIFTLSGRILPVGRSRWADGEETVAAHKGVNYCLGMTTPVLRSDLQHVAASEIKVGDRVVAFDEHPQGGAGGNNRYHHFRTAEVEAVSTVIKPSLRVLTKDGKATVCSTDHLWLARPLKGRQNNRPRVRWVRADELEPGDDLLSMGTWNVADNHIAGYLAGLYDGEGSLARHAGGRRHNQLRFSQNSGPVMDAMQAGMDELGLPYAYFERSPNSTSTTDSVQVSGLRNVMRTLGTLQPTRFRPRFEEVYEGNAITAGITESVAVTAVEPAGDLELASIQTSTRTLIANGYLSHNCIQGGAYDILAEAMTSIEDAGLGDAIYLAVHDELVVETEAAPDIRTLMQRPPERLCQLAERTPILRTDSLDLGERWAEA